ncbi:MAG: cysteine desulfurase NifS [Syntrophomonadaceae bacterium]|nr:cysteine desulfurase NifS [Syntrophomonadaceae bacterium]
MREIYMDHSATTPVDRKVFEAMIPYCTDEYGNPSSIHAKGRAAKKALEKAREQVAALINADSSEVFFTSGGTEANNQAIISYMVNNAHRGKHLITSAIEHHAVLDTCEYLRKNGFDLTVLPVNSLGVVEPEVLQRAIKPETTLVSIMHANNEIGTIQPIAKLAEVAHQAGAAFHTDAIQTTGRIPIDVKAMGIDLLSASSHKIYGPKGIGCLFIKKGIKIGRLMHGGAQENKMRAGTENVPGIVGFGQAAELAQNRMADTAAYLNKLGQKLRQGILDKIPHTIATGDLENRVPGSVSVCFEYVEGESILLMLDSYGIMASSGSACTSGSLDPSHVLLAIGLPPEIAHGSLRLTLGKNNTEEEIDYVLEVLPRIISNLRKMSPLYRNGGSG